MLLAFLLFVGTMLVFVLVVPSSYQGKTRILLKPSTATGSLLARLDLQQEFTVTSVVEYDTDIGLALTLPLARKVIDELQLKDRFGSEMTAEKLVKPSILNLLWPRPGVKVDQYEDSTILVVRATSGDPEEAAGIANLLAKYYLEKRRDIVRHEYTAAKEFVEQQIVAVRDRYYHSLERMKDFKIAEDAIDLDRTVEILMAKIASLFDAYENNESSLLLEKREIEELEHYLGRMEMLRLDSKEFTENPRLADLKLKLKAYLVELSGKSVDFTPSHPAYQQVVKERDEVERLIRQEVEMIFNQQRFAVDPLYDELFEKNIDRKINVELGLIKRQLLGDLKNTYQERLLAVPLKSFTHSKLTAELEVNADLYQNLRATLTEMGIAESIAFAGYQVVESAELPKKVHFPNKKLIMVVAVILGGIWALIAGFLVEYTDDTLRYNEDIEQFQYVNLLGRVYRLAGRGSGPLLDPSSPTSPAVETFRAILQRLSISGNFTPPATLMVTSSIRGEGKSTITANLALAYAMGGKKTLLVDGDLRTPRLGRIFAVAAGKGLSNLLAGEMEGVVPLATSFANLDLLPSGPVPADPYDLLERGDPGAILARFQQDYALVIIDSPPLTLSDTVILSRKTAAPVLLVARPGRVSYGTLAASLELLKRSGVVLCGVVTNRDRVA